MRMLGDDVLENWNPGPRRGREGAIEKQIAGKWHLTTLQEASDDVEHEILHERFHVTHFAGCAVLFIKDPFYPDISVKSIYLHDTRRGVQDHIVEGEHGWVLQGVLSRASCRRAAASGQKVFTVFSLHISNIYAEKKGIAKKLIQTLRAIVISQNIDSVAGDFNGAAWRCRSRDNISTIDQVFFLAVPCLRRWAPHSCGDLDPSRTIGLTSVVPLALTDSGKWTNMAPFSIPRQALGLRSSDQSCHNETRLHLHVVDWNNNWSRQAHYNGNIRLKDCPQKRHISELLSDHSLSSWVRNHLRFLVPVISLAHHHEVTWWALASSPDCHMWANFDIVHSWVPHASFSIANTMCIMTALEKTMCHEWHNRAGRKREHVLTEFWQFFVDDKPVHRYAIDIHAPLKLKAVLFSYAMSLTV